MYLEDKNSTKKNHTILGVTAFLCSLIFIITLMLISALTTVFSKSVSENADSIMSLLGWMLYGTVFLLFVSLLLGILGIREENAKRIFPTMAIIISSFGITSIMVLVFSSSSPLFLPCFPPYRNFNWLDKFMD